MTGWTAGERGWKLRVRRIGGTNRPWLIERVRWPDHRGIGQQVMRAHTFEDALRLLPAAWRLSSRVMRQVRRENAERWLVA